MQRFSNKIISPHAELTLVRFLELANEWLWDCEIRQCSSTTLANRKLVLDKFHWWLLHENLLHEKLHTNIFRTFFLYLRNAHKTPQGRFGGNCPAAFREPKPATLLLYYSVLRTFCNWLTREGVLSESPFQLIPSPLLRQKQIAPLNNQQIQQLLDATQKTFPPLRNQALILFLLDRCPTTTPKFFPRRSTP
jgi:site-specific recombinase XerD